MTHDQLARRVAKREAVSIRDARRVLDAAAIEIATALSDGDTVMVAGVVTLSPPKGEGGRTRFRACAIGTRSAERNGRSHADGEASATIVPEQPDVNWRN